MDFDDLKELLKELKDNPNINTTELVLRNASAKDATKLAEIDSACFSDPYTKDMFSHDIQYADNLTILTASYEGEIVGYIEIMIVLDECDIQRVAVLPKYRNMYIASVMMNAMLNLTSSLGIKSYTLEVRESNEAAIGLYEDFGFSVNGRRPKYYGDEDALLMLRIGDPDEFDPDKVS